MRVTQRRVYNVTLRFFSLFFLFVTIIALSGLASAQSMITGGTSVGTEIKEIPTERLTIMDLTNGESVKLKYFTLDGKDNKILIDISRISADFDFDDSSGKIEADMIIGKVGVASEGDNKRHYVFVEGEIGGVGCRIELDYTPGFSAITTSTAYDDPKDIPETPVKIIMKKPGTDAVLLDTHKSVALLQNLEPKPNVDWAEYFSLPKYLRKRPTPTTTETSSSRKPTPNRMSAEYKSTTKESASKILKEYKSVPGGVTLEGDGVGLDGFRQAFFRNSDNSIIVDNKFSYEIPVDIQEMKDICLSISISTKLGVSLSGNYIAYGAIPKDNDIMLTIRLVDEFLGHIAFGRQNSYKFADYELANGYVLKKQSGSVNSGFCVYFRFCDYKFRRNGTRYELTSSNLSITLVPTLKDQRAEDGGALPDFDAIDSGQIPDAWKNNCEHISANIGYYMNERMMRMVNCYGEAAAFARALKRNGINLKQLAESMGKS